MFWITALAFVMAAALAKLGAAPVAVAVLSAALWSAGAGIAVHCLLFMWLALHG